MGWERKTGDKETNRGAFCSSNNRNWRWHKRQQVWLTKDDLMMPQVLSMNHERGFYIVWNTVAWGKERVSLKQNCRMFLLGEKETS